MRTDEHLDWMRKHALHDKAQGITAEKKAELEREAWAVANRRERQNLVRQKWKRAFKAWFMLPPLTDNDRRALVAARFHVRPHRHLPKEIVVLHVPRLHAINAGNQEPHAERQERFPCIVALRWQQVHLQERHGRHLQRHHELFLGCGRN